jgi:hypothetical protein
LGVLIGLVESNHFANLRLRATDETPEITPPTPQEFHALLDACTVPGGLWPGVPGHDSARRLDGGEAGRAIRAPVG